MTCIICELRPANGNGFCHNCDAKIEAEKHKAAAEKPFKYVTYQGHVVGFFHTNGGKTINARLLGRNPQNLPKGKTIDLNTYQDGFSREQVKKLKSCVLRLANA